ncbi:MAG: ribonuclease HI [Paludibacteraceae bacterium]|nr:ribonuclease HI [Paludibacteraceae bacterium]
MNEVCIYIDGSCSGNPGPGGWSAVCECNGKIRQSSGYENYATNNSMELKGAIGALKALRIRGCDVILYTDSAYLISNANHDDEWLIKPGHANRELWIEYLRIRNDGKYNVKFVKVKAHSGNKMNELADKYAKQACMIAKHCAKG